MLSTHSCFAAEAGFTPPEVRQLRDGVAPFSPRLDALVRLARNVAVERGYADTALLDGFYGAGYSQENLVDLMMAIGHVTIGSYLSNACQVPLDFPAAARR
jgi:alkylhydroperoxidase family enzyme